MDSCCCGNKIKKEKEGRKPKEIPFSENTCFNAIQNQTFVTIRGKHANFFYYLCSIIIHHLKTAVTEEMCQVFKSFRNSHLF